MLRRRYLVAFGLIVLSLLLYFALPAGPSLKLKMLVTQLFSPVLRVGASLRNSWDTARREFQSRTGLLEENRQLRDQLALLMQETLRVQELEDENRRLRDIAGYRQADAPRRRAARVIDRTPSQWWKTVYVDAGTNQGVRENGAVVTPSGLVGKVISVGLSTATVLLITDPNCKVSAIIQENPRDPGVVEGVFTGVGGTPVCRMDFINRDAVIRAGSTVITSGMGGVFPKGIRIGTVAKPATSRAGLYKQLEIKPAADLERLEEVIILLH
jgi:rod shape-determining protein MreC